MDRKTDRRIFERIDGELAVRYSPEGSNGEYSSVTRNISGNGVRISLNENLTPGTRLDIEIFRNSSNVGARCKGEVRWIYRLPTEEKKKSFEAGIKLLNSSFLHIGKLIKEIKPESLAIQ